MTLTIEDADRIRRNPGAFDPELEAQARRVLRDHIHVAATMPPRTHEAYPAADFRSPQEQINRRTMDADYRAAWRAQLAFGVPLVALALFAVVLFAADPIGELAKWRWAEDHAEAMK